MVAQTAKHNDSLVVDTFLIFGTAQLQSLRYMILSLYKSARASEFSVQRDNIVLYWKRNFFLNHLFVLTQALNNPALRIFYKYYIILRQLLDDVTDIKQDIAEGKLTLPQLPHWQHFKKRFINHSVERLQGLNLPNVYYKLFQLYLALL